MRGDQAIPLYCYDAAKRSFASGGACLDAAPSHATLAGTTPLDAELESRTVCADGPESRPVALPVYHLNTHTRDSVLLFEGTGAPFENLVQRDIACDLPCEGPPPYVHDLDGDGRAETLRFLSDGVHLDAGLARTVLLTRPGETGPYTLLALSDLDGDGASELVLARDFRGLWEVTTGEITRTPEGPALAPLFELGCGELG